MLDKSGISLARTTAWGWGWHGLILQQRGGSAVTVQLPNGRTYIGADGGRDRVIRVANWTYLWDIGHPDMAPTEAESARGARFDGRAILRGLAGPLYAYGNAYFGTYDPREICGWPVRFDGRTGRALLRIGSTSSGAPDAERLELLIYPDVVLGAPTTEPVIFNLDVRLSEIGQGTDQPDLYEGSEELAPKVEGVRWNSLDISRDGRSLLIGLSPLVTNNLVRMINVAKWCGLLRLSITGNPGENGNLGYQLIVEQSRSQALGELIDDLSGPMASVSRYPNPRETVSTPQPWPQCGVEEVVEVAGFTTTPNSSPGVACIEGVQTYRHGQNGVMAGAWFDSEGAVQVLRFDSIMEQRLDITVTDDSIGERRERRVYTAGPSECTADLPVISDDRAYRLNGRITDEKIYRLKLYNAGGGAFDEHVLRVTNTHTEYYDSTRDPNNQWTGRTVIEVNGAVVVDETSEPDGGSLAPGAGTPFGYSIRELLSRYSAEVGGLSISEHQIRVLNGSNKVTMLAYLKRTQGGPDPVTFSKALTPTGAVDGMVSRTVEHDTGLQPRQGFDSVDGTWMTRASYNPVTHQVERHREDRASFGWV